MTETEFELVTTRQMPPEPGVEPAPMAPYRASGGNDYAPLIAAARGIQRPADKMLERAKWIGAMLAGGALYSFPVGGQRAEGASIDLAQALGQEWKGIVYEVEIVSATPLGGGQRVHLRARVIDLVNVVAVSVDQVVSTSAPSKGFAKNAEQSERWHMMQLQSAASKIVRNAILRILPAWYVDAAIVAARAAANDEILGGKTVAEVREAMLGVFAKHFRMTSAELAAWLDVPVELWAVPQLRALRDLLNAFRSKESSPELVREELKKAAAPARSAAAPVPSHLATEQRALPDSGPRQELLPESPALQGQERVPVGREPGDDRDDDGPPSM